MIEDIEVLNCPTCLGFWIGAIVSIIVCKQGIIDFKYAILLPLLVSLWANIMDKLTAYIEIKILKEPNKDECPV